MAKHLHLSSSRLFADGPPGLPLASERLMPASAGLSDIHRCLMGLTTSRKPQKIRAERKEFYVYQYSHPATGVPFYIGKGKGSRYRAHLRPPPHDMSPKAVLIRELLAAGTPPVITFLERKMLESAAFAIEVATIQRLGRAPNGPLLNRSHGGEGACPGISQAEVEWLAEVRRQEREERAAERAARAAERARRAEPARRASVQDNEGNEGGDSVAAFLSSFLGDQTHGV